MPHRLDIDHRNGRLSFARRSVVRSRDGRIESISATLPRGEPHALADALRSAIEGEVHFEAGSRALYSTDASNYRQVPIGVVIPKTVDDVVATVELCGAHDVPMLARGGGTSLAGQTCNVAVVIDFSKHLDRILELEPERRKARVEPGCVLDTLRGAAEEHGLTFGPDPATHDHNTLGGMLGNNSCGVHSLMAGRTSDNVEALEILTYDGLRMHVGATSDGDLAAIIAGGGRRAEIYRQLDDFRRRYGDLIRRRYPKIPRRVSGYENLDELRPEKGFNVARALVGTEGTCVTILSAELRLVESPPVRVLVVIGFDDIFAAADAVPDVLTYQPIGLEGMDELLVDFLQRKHLHHEDISLLPQGNGRLLAEFGGETLEQARDLAAPLARAYASRGNSVKLLCDARQQARLWAVREAALAATAHVPDMPEAHPGWEDSAVAREQLGAYLRDLKALLHRHGYDASVYGHFGDGLVHCRIPFRLRSEQGVRDWQRFLEEAADLVVRYGGSLSGEHGDGQARAGLLQRMYGTELVQAFAEFKAIWDPRHRMNPGKVVAPFPPTSNLRIGPGYHPRPVQTHFSYSQDDGSFAKATRRCVGVGKCRRPGSSDGVMCPSYMVTRDEQHSTRGRARLLFEMLEASPIEAGWRSKAVAAALDLCLACKGCKRDCPVSVDMATYKAEFRAHHYAYRLRPRAAYSMGLIHRWARLAALAPSWANVLTQSAALAALAKAVGGIARERRLPVFAQQTFRGWFAKRRIRPRSGKRVVLWPDTFNDYFRPGTAIAATRVLESLGYEVAIPNRPLCCGRPLYDWGMIKSARKQWQTTLSALREDIEAGTPVVGLEPACVSAFMDELPDLFPRDATARRLSRQVSFFSDFVASRVNGGTRLEVDRPVLVQVHCHHHATIGYAGEQGLLDALAVKHEVLPSGCCGMAGSFGFETEKYRLSIQLAERVLLPRLRAAPSGTLVLANGFSCREQIEQGSALHSHHIADALWMLLQPRSA